MRVHASRALCGRLVSNDRTMMMMMHTPPMMHFFHTQRGGYRVAVLDEHQWAQQSAGENVIMLLGVLSAAGVDLEAASPALMHAYLQVQRNTQFL